MGTEQHIALLTPVLVLVEVVPCGYCHRCLHPQSVGVFELKGWKHRFHLCSICLGELIREIIQQGSENLPRR